VEGLGLTLLYHIYLLMFSLCFVMVKVPIGMVKGKPPIKGVGGAELLSGFLVAFQ
jgi:hypothetical protein